MSIWDSWYSPLYSFFGKEEEDKFKLPSPPIYTPPYSMGESFSYTSEPPSTIVNLEKPIKSMGAGATSSFQALIDKIGWTAKKALTGINLWDTFEDEYLKFMGEAVRSGKMKEEDIPAAIRSKYGTPNQPSLVQPGSKVDKLIDQNAIYPLREKTTRLVEELRKEGVQDPFISQILEGIGSAAVDVPTYMTTGNIFGPINFAIHGFIEGMERTGDNIAAGGVPGAIRGVLTDKIFRATNRVFGEGTGTISRQVARRTAAGTGMAAAGALGTITETGELPSMRDVTAGFITGAALPIGKKRPILEPAARESPGGIPEDINSFVEHLEKLALGIESELTTRGSQEPRGSVEIIKPIETPGPGKISEKETTYDNISKLPGYKEAGWWNRYWGSKEASIENLGKVAREMGVSDPMDPDVMVQAARGWIGMGHAVIEAGTYRLNEQGKPVVTGEGIAPVIKDFVSKSSLKPKDAYNLLDEYFKLIRIEHDLQARIPVYNETGKTPVAVSTGGIDKASQVDLDFAKDRRPKFNYLFQGDPNLKNVFDEALNRKNDFQHRLLDMWVDAGLLSGEEATKIKAENPNHVPFNRIVPGTDYDFFQQLTGRVPWSAVSLRAKASGRGPGGLKEFKGGEYETENSIEELIRRVYAMAHVATQNKVKLAIAGMGEFLPEEIYQVEDKKFVMAEITKAEIEREIKKRGGNIEPGEFESMKVFRKEDIQHLGPDEMLLYRDGTAEIWRVPETIAEVYRKYTPETAATAARLLKYAISAPKRWLQRGSTSLNPMFSVVRNPIKDNLSAWYQTNIGFVPFADPAWAVFDMIGKTELYWDYLRSGGGLEGYNVMNRKNIMKTAREIAGNKSILEKINPITKLESMGNFMETLTRLGVFKRAMESGESSLKAATTSRGATLDFARSGWWGKEVNSVSDFFNANIQGGVKLFKAFTNPETRKSAWMKAVSTVTLAEALSFLLNHKDEETARQYKSAPPYEKDYFWRIPLGPGLPTVRIPKPVGWGQIFGSLPGRAMSYIHDKDPHAFDGIVSTLIGSVSPVEAGGGKFLGLESILPTAVQVALECSFNIDLFKNQPLYPTWKGTERLPEYRETKVTNEMYRDIGKLPIKLGLKTGIEPAVIEHAVEGLTGSFGKAIGDIADAILYPGKKRKPREPAVKNIPFIEQLFSADSSQSPVELNRFYRWATRMGEARGSYLDLEKQYEAAKKRRNSKEMESYQSEIKSLVGRFPMVRDIDYKKITAEMRNLTDLNNQIDDIVNSDLSREEKRKKIMALDRERWRIAIILQKKFGF